MDQNAGDLIITNKLNFARPLESEQVIGPPHLNLYNRIKEKLLIPLIVVDLQSEENV